MIYKHSTAFKSAQKFSNCLKVNKKRKYQEQEKRLIWNYWIGPTKLNNVV